MKFRSLIYAAAAAVVLAATPSFANSVVVEYSDLDLSSAHGKQVLERRLDDAARETCGLKDLKTGSILHPSAERKCYRATRKDLDQRFAMIVERANKGG